MIQMVLARDLKMGDVVQAFDDAFGTAVVTKVDEKESAVTLFRPYAITGDYSHTGGVTPYTGAETWRICRDQRVYKVYSRKEVK